MADDEIGQEGLVGLVGLVASQARRAGRVPRRPFLFRPTRPAHPPHPPYPPYPPNDEETVTSMSLDQLLAWVPAGGVEAELATQMHPDRLPRHVAIIMDGNGRWAGRGICPASRASRRDRRGARRRRNVGAARPRGADALRVLGRELEAARAEVGHADDAAQAYMRSELQTLLSNNIRFNVIGRSKSSRPTS